MLLDETPKDRKVLAINEKMEEMRKRNEEILRRYQEIEDDKKNAENFSKEAVKCVRVLRQEENTEKPEGRIETDEKTAQINNSRPKRESRKIAKPIIPSEQSEISKFRPQRLTEADMPPADPVYSYLTDRLREGAFCSPISPRQQRKSSTTSSSEMSVSSGNSSRKTSTASNSSWTSDGASSSKYNGFANYQPPRKFSACRNYVRSQRKNSDQLSEHYIVAKQDPAKNTWNEIPVSTKTNWKTGREENTVSAMNSATRKPTETRIATGKYTRKESNRLRTDLPLNWRSHLTTANHAVLQGTWDSTTENDMVAYMEGMSMSISGHTDHDYNDLNNNNGDMINKNIID